MGIMVGRGTSPVTFDTQKFQKRLEMIAKEFGEKTDTRVKMDLTFYDALDRPVAEESGLSQNTLLEIIPKKEIQETETPETEALETETMLIPAVIPLKTSRKKQTFKPTATKAATEIRGDDISRTKQGIYTLQIAAYKEFKDAVSQMALLDEKGFSSYKVKGQKDGVTWYRVRAGSFGTWDEAEKFKEKLSAVKINSMIITKDKDEDINE